MARKPLRFEHEMALAVCNILPCIHLPVCKREARTYAALEAQSLCAVEFEVVRDDLPQMVGFHNRRYTWWLMKFCRIGRTL
jgi:peroxiredoxin